MSMAIWTSSDTLKTGACAPYFRDGVPSVETSWTEPNSPLTLDVTSICRFGKLLVGIQDHELSSDESIKHSFELSTESTDTTHVPVGSRGTDGGRVEIGEASSVAVNVAKTVDCLRENQLCFS